MHSNDTKLIRDSSSTVIKWEYLLWEGSYSAIGLERDGQICSAVSPYMNPFTLFRIRKWSEMEMMMHFPQLYNKG